MQHGGKEKKHKATKASVVRTKQNSRNQLTHPSEPPLPFRLCLPLPHLSILVLDNPHRLLQHQQISLDRLCPVLHIPNLLQLLPALISNLLVLSTLFRQSRRLLGDVTLLFGDDGGVGMDVLRAGLKAAVKVRADGGEGGGDGGAGFDGLGRWGRGGFGCC